jgi:hypothetical protein
MIRELQLTNDNLRWKLNQQAVELRKAAETIQKLSEENAKLAKSNCDS